MAKPQSNQNLYGHLTSICEDCWFALVLFYDHSVRCKLEVHHSVSVLQGISKHFIINCVPGEKKQKKRRTYCSRYYFFKIIILQIIISSRLDLFCCHYWHQTALPVAGKYVLAGPARSHTHHVTPTTFHSTFDEIMTMTII